MRRVWAGIWRARCGWLCTVLYCGTMSLFNHLLSRQYSTSPSSRVTGHLWSVFESLQCHYNDEVVFYGGMTEAPVPVFVCKFSPDSLRGNLLATGDEEGSVRLMNTQRVPSHALIREIEAHRNAVFDIAWVPRDHSLLSASGDATIRHWDVVGGALRAEFRVHTASVKSIDVNADEPSMFVSGGRDGSIHVWDTRCAKRGSQHRPVNSIAAAHKKPSENGQTGRRKQTRGRRSAGPPSSLSSVGDTKYSVTTVLFHGNHKIASCGTADGVVKLWDLRRTYTNSRLEPPPAWFTFEPVTDSGRQYSFTSLVSGPYQSTLFASCTDHMCYMYNSAGLNKLPVSVFGGHQNSSFYVKSCVSSDGRYLLSGSSCGNAFIWQIDRPHIAPLMLTGHTKEVTAVAWCPSDVTRIVTCSDDCDLRLWRVAHGRKAPGEITGRCQQYAGSGHLKGIEVLRQHYEAASSRATQSRTPLHPTQQKSSINSTPSSVSNHTIKNRMSQHSSAPNTQVPSKQPAVADRKRDGVSTAQLSSTGSGCGKETSSKWHNCLSKCRKLATKSEDATASTSNHDPLKNPLHEQNSKQSIEQSPQPSHTGNNVPLGHSSVTPHTAAAVAMTTEVTGVDLSKEGSAEVTPESLRVTCTLGSGSATKRRLKLEEGVSCRPGTKRRRTSTRDSSKKQPVAKVDSSPLEVKKSVQMTMQSFFRPS